MAKKVSKLLSFVLVAALALSLAVAAIWNQPAQALTADEITAAQTAAATELANAQTRADKAWNALQGLPTPEEVKAGAALPTTCPYCGKKTTDSSKKLVWAVIEGEQATNISGTSGTYSGTSVHVFLTGDVTYNGESGSAFLTAPYNSGIMCVFTNGYNITSSKKPAYFGTTWKSNIIAWNRAGRNVPGSVIKGYATGDESGSTVIANPGSDYNEVHLFGGTYEKYDPASTANVIAQHGNAGKYYIYEGTTVNAGTKGSAVFLNGDMTYGRAELNMYGGTINGGTGKAAVGVETSSKKAANASNKETFYCTFNMYGGTVNGGKGRAAVEAIDESHATARGEKDCRINIYGGAINGAETGDSFAIRLSAAKSDLKIYGGTITGKSGTISGSAIRTEVASKITIAGGTINGGTTAYNGGAMYINAAATLNINGGTITGGTAKAGGNIYLGNGATATMTGGTISGGEARGESGGGGNVYVYNTGTSFTMTGGRIENGICVYNTDGETKLTNVYGPNIYVNAGTVNISGGTISGGLANNATGGGSIYMTGAGDTADTSGYATLNISGNAVIENGVNEGGSGGNICAYRGLVTISGNAKIQGGDAKSNGGNIQLDKYSTLTIGDSAEISGGKAGANGGNISIITNASLTMNGGTIKDGESTKLGGNIYAASDINATDGDILNGVAGTSGGNICITGCTVTLGDGVLVDNGYAKISGSSGNGGGNIYMRDGNPTLNTSATITNGKVDGKAAAGGNINVSNGCTLNVTGGLIANGKVLYDGDGSSWGGNIRSYGDKNTYINISGGTIYGGTSPQGAANVGIQYNENVTISGGEFLGGVTLSKSLTSLKLEGKLQFTRTKTIDKKTYYDYISIGNGTKADISQLDPESVIYVTATSGAAIALADENAANLRKCFITLDKNYCVTAKTDNQLYYTKHTKTTITAKAATCEDVGYAVDALYCATCKEYYNSDYTARLEESDVVIPSLGGHQIVNHDAKAPTCTEIGWDAYETCSRCDYTTYVEQSALGHKYTGVETTAPTCEGKGVMTYTCANDASHTYTEEIAATGHDYESVVTAPTCEADGYTTHTCKNDPTHTYVDNTVAALGHKYTGVETTAPTCEGKGVMTYTCANCGDTYTEEIAAAGHTIVLLTPEVKPTNCITPGKEAVYTCTVCGAYFSDAEGKNEQDSETPDIIFPDGHQLTFVEASAATCEANGKMAHYLCSVCGGTYAENDDYATETMETVIPALGHKYTNYIYNNDATYEADGTETATCDNGCGATDTRTAEGTKLTFVPSGHVAYRADVTDKADREGIAILLKEVNARESLVVKVYCGDTLMFVSTRRAADLDDEQSALFPVLGKNTTANIVLWGKESGSWINEILVTPTSMNVPNKIEVWADGVLTDTYTHESGSVLGTNLEKYLALECVETFTATNKETGVSYNTLAEALAAAKTGETVKLLTDVDASSEVVLLMNGIKLDLCGKELKALYLITTTGGSEIIDSTDGEGILVMAKKNLTLVNPACLPVWSEAEGGYRFVTLGMDIYEAEKNAETLKLQYWFTGALDGAMKEQLAKVAENDLKVVLRVDYTTSDGAAASLDIIVPAEKIVQYANTNDAYFVTTIRGLNNLGNAKITVLTTYDNIEIAGATYDYEAV